MNARAYYSEHDPSSAAWLRELIAAGLIAPGDVDERSVSDVLPDDLRPYTQCHFFAGIGGWSYALRLAGWPDDRPVWTGSCPCQPFSTAGARGGFADERHLWPDFHWLIEQCRPSIVFGEQVASGPAGPWIDLVQDDMEGLGYSFGAAVLPACGVGAPHIRQRLFFVADSGGEGRGQIGSLPGRCGERSGSEGLDERPLYGGAVSMADSLSAGLEGRDTREMGDECTSSERGGETGGVGHPECQFAGRDARAGASAEGGTRLRPECDDSRSSGSACRGMGDPDPSGRRGLPERDERPAAGVEAPPRADAERPGFWDAVEWLPCRDGKARPTQPGLFPLAHGISGRVGLLRGAGNAIVPQVAAAFIEASMISRAAITGGGHG